MTKKKNQGVPAVVAIWKPTKLDRQKEIHRGMLITNVTTKNVNLTY